MKTIYRKLKDYIAKTESGSTFIFGDLMSRDCCYCYKDKNGEWHDWFGVGIYGHEMDFLLNYYVVGISAKYKIERDKIVTYLQIILYKEKPEL